MNTNSQSQTQQAPQAIDPHYQSPTNGGSIIKKLMVFTVIIVILILLVLGLLFIIKVVGGDKKNEKVTLLYWGIWDDSTIMAPIISDFERIHPNININYEKRDIKGLGNHVDTLSARILNGSGPDIFRFHSSWTAQLKKLLMPFPKTVVEQMQLEKDYYKTVEKDMKIGGAYYGIPMGIDTLSLYVNTKILSEKGLQVPKDWSDIYGKYAPELVVKSDGKITNPAISLGTYDNISHAPDIIALLMLQNGADISDLSGPTRSNAEDALRYYTSFAQGKNAVWSKTLDNSTLAFAKGNLPLYFGYSWDIFTIKAINPDLEFQTVKVPSLPGRSETVSSYWAEGISVKTKNSKAAFEFLTYLSKTEVLQKLHSVQAKARLFGNLYPRKSMAPLLSSNVLVYPFIAQADDARSTFFSADTYDGENGMVTRMNVYLGNAVRSVNENTSVDSAIDTLSTGIAQVLGQYK